jgi:hypothetical protein
MQLNAFFMQFKNFMLLKIFVYQKGLSPDNESIVYNTFINTTKEQTFTISNLNNIPLTRLEWVYSKNSLFNLTLTARNATNNTYYIKCTERCIIADRLEEGAIIYITFTFISYNEIKQFDSNFAFITAEKLYTTMSLYITAVIPRPLITTAPANGLDFRVINDQKYFFQLDITNMGTLKATNVTIKIPQSNLNKSNIKIYLIDIISPNNQFQTNLVNSFIIYYSEKSVP